MSKKNAYEFVTSFVGEYANDYRDFYEYIINGGWEKDYFSDWLDRISADCVYPTLDDIIAECKFANRQIALYLDVVEEQKEKSRINAISV